MQKKIEAQRIKNVKQKTMKGILQQTSLYQGFTNSDDIGAYMNPETNLKPGAMQFIEHQRAIE